MTSKPRTPVTLDQALYDQVTEYREKYGITSQSKAMQQLIRKGLGENPTQKKSNSMNEAGLDYQERELIQMAKTLDPERKRMLLQIAAVVASKDSRDRPYTP